MKHSGAFFIGLIFSHFPDTFAADILAAEGNQIPERAAEYAGGFKLLQNDTVVFHINFQFVPFGDIQGTSQFDGQNDSSQFIYFSNDTC